MKKLISLILSATMLISMAPVALAADNNLGNTLASVTEKVKDQLDIGNEYTQFNGTAQDNGLNEYWNLLWENEDGVRLSVDANTEGKIMGYYYSSATDDYTYSQEFAPAFPKLKYDDAKAIAEKFLNSVLDTATESVEFSDFNETMQPQNITNYYFSGKLKLNGVVSPIDFSVQVNVSSKSVRSFSRGDFNTKYIGSVPSATPAAKKDDAATLLKNAIKMKLEYTTNNGTLSNEENDKAVLRYFPVYTGNYLVDAQTGKLINADDLFASVDQGTFDKGMEMQSGTIRGSEGNLSDVEKEGIDKLAGVLTKDKLDATIRTMSELNLTGFALTNSSYFRNDDGTYYCNLTYSKADAGNEITRKYINVDAKSAELISLYTNYPYEENVEKGSVPESELQKTAESFLAKYRNDDFSKTKLYTDEEVYTIYNVENSTEKSFTYAQQVNGYFFPENAYQVSVNTTSGYIDSFSGSFSEVSFDSADGIVTMQQAKDAYFNAFETTLAYVNIPKKLDLSTPGYEKYISYGYNYLYELKLAYVASSNNMPYAVDAKTGKILCHDVSNIAPILYADVKTGKEILGLASYGIGYAGGTFEKTKQLTQVDMVALLVCADGYVYNPLESKNAADELYQMAYRLGILKKNERNDNQNITRAELVKTILSMSGYGMVAELPGIYVCSFKDEKSIPSEYYGYVAISQGLGMVKGGASHMFEPNTVATREDAAVMLYNFMNR